MILRTKKLVAAVMMLCITLCCFTTLIKREYACAETAQSKLPTVIIDAGHGGFDGGAVADDGTTEKVLNLQISVKLAEILQEYGFKTVLTRKNDTALCDPSLKGRQGKNADLARRVEIANSTPNSLFISIHQNKFDSEKVCGLQVFYNGASEKSASLAECIQSSVHRDLQPDNNRVAKSDTRKVYILENSKIPTVIVECGFISNKSELASLKSSSYRCSVAFCIANGILEYSAE